MKSRHASLCPPVLYVALALALLSNQSYAQSGLSPRPAPIDSSQQIADRIISSRVPVVVDFWAPWCAPCRHLDPILKDLEKEFGNKMRVIKVNIDIHRAIASYFQISSIPAVFIVKDSAVTHAITGLRSKEVYRQALLESMGNASIKEKTSSPPPPASTRPKARP